MPPDGTSGTNLHVCQIMISWPYRSGFLDDPLPLEVPQENSERLALAKRLSTSWAEPFRSIVHDIPEGTEVKPVNLQDWVPQREACSTGNVALIGDAAHSMVMCTYETSRFILLSDKVSSWRRCQPCCYRCFKSSVKSVSPFKSLQRPFVPSFT